MAGLKMSVDFDFLRIKLMASFNRIAIRLNKTYTEDDLAIVVFNDISLELKEMRSLMVILLSLYDENAGIESLADHIDFVEIEDI